MDHETCVICCEKFTLPYITECGHTYDLNCVSKWLKEHGTEPTTRKKQLVFRLTPNWFVAKQLNLEMPNASPVCIRYDGDVKVSRLFFPNEEWITQTRNPDDDDLVPNPQSEELNLLAENQESTIMNRFFPNHLGSTSFQASFTGPRVIMVRSTNSVGNENSRHPIFDLIAQDFLHGTNSPQNRRVEVVSPTNTTNFLNGFTHVVRNQNPPIRPVNQDAVSPEQNTSESTQTEFGSQFAEIKRIIREHREQAMEMQAEITQQLNEYETMFRHGNIQ